MSPYTDETVLIASTFFIIVSFPSTTASQSNIPAMLRSATSSLAYESTIPNPTIVEIESIAMINITPILLENFPNVSLQAIVIDIGNGLCSKENVFLLLPAILFPP